MSPLSQYDFTKRRLKDYGLFSDDVIKTVAEVARQQQRYGNDYKKLFKDLKIGTPKLHISQKGNGVPVVDVPAQKSPAIGGTIVLHLPMANPLDPNQLFQVATIVAVNPQCRVIAFGNPSNKPYYYRQQKLSLNSLFKIAFTNEKSSLVEAEQDYLKVAKVSNIHHVGFSYGALKALISFNSTPEVQRKSLTVLEPVAQPRGIVQLAKDFQHTFEHLGYYVDRAGTPAYLNARKDSETKGWQNRQYTRLINIAISLMLAKTDFIKFFKRTVIHNPTSQFVIAWAAKSELGNDVHTQASLADIKKSEQQHLEVIRLKDEYHAFANDLYLHAALIKKSLNLTTSINRVK